jgi:hypothetical protein
MHEFFTCPRHGGIHAMSAYRRHMDDAHDGRTDCVRAIPEQEALTLVRNIAAIERDTLDTLRATAGR